jgi:hypothetical protein
MAGLWQVVTTEKRKLSKKENRGFFLASVTRAEFAAMTGM